MPKKIKNIKEIMESRISTRNFSGEAVDMNEIEEILKLSQRSQSSINGQQISLIVTSDKEKISKIADIAWGQEQIRTAELFITIVIDYNRTNEAVKLGNKEQIIENTLEGLLVGAVDAGIYLQSIQTLLEGYNYGTTAIGGIRSNPQAMIDLLELPPKTFPVVGLTVGQKAQEVTKDMLRPRIDFNSYVHNEKYNSEIIKDSVINYDNELKNWWKDKGMDNKDSYIESISNFYSKNYAPLIKETLQNQGFLKDL